VVALLGQVTGSEVGDHPPGRQRQTKAGEGGAHPLARLAHRLVRQAHDHEGRRSGDLLHLHLHPAGFDPFEGHRDDTSGHERSPLIRGLA
jgi:hypothetical protein